MIKLNILNMDNFLDTINACQGEVYMIYPGGTTVNIHRQRGVQDGLSHQYHKNKNHLPLVLKIPNPKDYMRIVSYYAGDC